MLTGEESAIDGNDDWDGTEDAEEEEEVQDDDDGEDRSAWRMNSIASRSIRSAFRDGNATWANERYVQYKCPAESTANEARIFFFAPSFC